MRQKRALAVVVLLFSLIVLALSGISVSWLGFPYSTQRTCSETWSVSSCGFGGLESDFDDSFDLAGTCNGSQVGNKQHVKDVYLNQTDALFGQTLSVTCAFYQYWWTNSYRDEQYVFYYNGSDWVKIAEWQTDEDECGGQGYCFFNKTTTFTVNASEGTQVVRCIVDYEGSSDSCADESPAKTHFYYDNDDVNFTAVKPLENTTSYELSVPNGANVSRAQNITAHVQWNKIINESQIVHMGSGTIAGYSVPSPYTGNWTNYTLVLSNTTEFNHTGPVTLVYINAVDDYEQWVQINQNKHFYLWSSANITSAELSRNITYNGTQVDFSCTVFDNYTHMPVSGYNVSFYRNGTFFDNKFTDSTGVAEIESGTGAATPPENWTYTCNITEMPSIYYNSSFEQSIILQIVDLGVSIAPIENTGFGSNVTITANITGNATRITDVNANISYYNHTSGQHEWDEVLLSAIKTYSQINTEYSANYTPKIAGMHNVTVEAQAERHPDEVEIRVVRNTTSFELGGGANITNISLSDSIIYNGTSTVISCRVANNYSGEPIKNYNVSFFNSTHYLGMGRTNSSGWANITYNDFTENPSAIESLKCNITDMPELFYNASSMMSTTLNIVDLRINIEPMANADFGDNITVKFNVTGNATQLDSVVASVRYYNYSLNGYTSDIVVLASSITHSPTNTEYSGIYTVVQSGPHEATVTANAVRTAENETLFNVSYGIPSISFTFPNFRVLTNQSFNLTAKVLAIEGDIINPVLILNFTND
ncbi:MAG: hypothetical protein KAJ24_05135, partial [Candidatus Aenigmarchaeota archaeon]|nr:hypothetical protein [Candidatus Aenigmarchaeota archaeon]